jgi:ribonuclease HII
MVSLECLENLNVKEIKVFLDTIKADYCGESKSRLKKLVKCMESDSRSAVQIAAESLTRHLAAYDSEVARVTGLYRFDSAYGDYKYIAGVDEVGRGPLAGPIVAASVILYRDSLESRDIILGINDSKKLSPRLREELAGIIKDKAACFNIHQYESGVIDEKGISWCNNEVLRNAAENLSVKPQLVISDGYPIRGAVIRNEFAVKGDSKSASIACASILAKVYRDGLMKEYDKLYPEYGFASNSGYGSMEHIEAIKRYGATEIHRKSFLSNILGNR